VLLSLLAVGLLALVAWTIYLNWRLPKVYVSDHWRVAWVGLDVIEVIALLLTTWAAFARRVVLVIFATAGATAFALDAWFDVTTARSGDFRQSLFTALLVEIPAAVVLYVVAAVSTRRVLSAWYRHWRGEPAPSMWRIEIPHPDE
jgi:hypothetical protein